MASPPRFEREEARGFVTDVDETGCVPEFPWDVVVTINMAPDLRALTAIEMDWAVRPHRTEVAPMAGAVRGG